MPYLDKSAGETNLKYWKAAINQNTNIYLKQNNDFSTRQSFSFLHSPEMLAATQMFN